MRLWADERSAGTDELLLSLPLGMPGLVLGKLCAAWTVAGVGLIFTFPMWVTGNYLGEPDNAAIFLTYLVSFLMAGAYLSIGSAICSPSDGPWRGRTRLRLLCRSLWPTYGTNPIGIP